MPKKARPKKRKTLGRPRAFHQCSLCKSNHSPSWRKGLGNKNLCNVCGLRLKRALTKTPQIERLFPAPPSIPFSGSLVDAANQDIVYGDADGFAKTLETIQHLFPLTNEQSDEQQTEANEHTNASTNAFGEFRVDDMFSSATQVSEYLAERNLELRQTRLVPIESWAEYFNKTVQQNANLSIMPIQSIEDQTNQYNNNLLQIDYQYSSQNGSRLDQIQHNNF